MIDEMESQREELMTKEITGMGFRGRIFGELCYRGFEVDPLTNRVTVDGRELSDEEDITFVTVDHFRYISLFPHNRKRRPQPTVVPVFPKGGVRSAFREKISHNERKVRCYRG